MPVFLAASDYTAAWNIERAHVLGQHSTRAHVPVHRYMLRFAWHRRDWHELSGQVSRIIGAALFTRIWVPEGNTGGANVSAFQAMPVAADLRRVLDEDQRATR